MVLLGRTGNNMFQYALGRVLAAKHGVPLVLDGSWFGKKGWGEVSHFLRTPIHADVRRHPAFASRVLLKLTGKHYWEYTDIPVIRENESDHTFDPSILNAPADCMIFGYFQSPLYFESIEAEIREEFQAMLAGANTANPDLRAELSAPNSVAIHVRRTDYTEIPAFAVCGSHYYSAAMDEMSMRIPGARFFIFSDDPEWCRSEFAGADRKVVSEAAGSRSPLEDMHLMSLAPHHIIANSTYSWWAAWIAKSQTQEVMMPDRWIASETIVPISEKKLPHWTVVPTRPA